MTQQRSVAETRAYPDWLLEVERVALDTRRGKLSVPIEADAPRVGLALSGGGIRSATFSLGLVQTLARSGVLPRVDYLSTVSGGGYTGSFLGALYARGASDAEVSAKLTGFPESHELAWLRNNGRFLAPNGAGANWLAGAVFLRNWLSLLVMLAPLAFCFAFVSVLATAALHQGLAQPSVAALVGRYGWPLSLAGLTLSPLAILPALCAAFWMLPCGVAYWMVNAGHRDSTSRRVSAAALAVTLLGPSGVAYQYRHAEWHPLPVVLGIAGITAGAFFMAGVLRWRLQAQSGAREAEPAVFDPFGPDRDNIARNKLSEWLKGGLMAAAVTSIITAVDTLSFAAFEAVSIEGQLSAAIHELMALASGVGAVVLGTHRILAQFGSSKAPGGSRVPVALLIAVAALALIAIGAIVIGTITYWLAVPDLKAKPVPEPWLAGLGVIASFLAMAVLGRFIVFVNQSSLGPLYSARLTRAYVGASNPLRWQSDSRVNGKESPTEPLPGDQLAWEKYNPHASGGPIHLINVTVNETVDPRVQLHQPDRKGMIMAVGPMGVSLGVRHHASWDGKAPAPDAEVFQVFPTGKELVDAERLPVGHWVAISGAAVSTGLGQLSRWGASLLCGVFNMRLGYWWSSNVSAKGRPHQARALSPSAGLMSLFGHYFPVYRLLAAEFSNRFPGTASKSWYLTDGGHLENTGCYELIRRRVPFVICVDNGADPGAQCSDLANLVRLARVDFGAEVEFIDAAGLSELLDPAVREYFGSVQDLKRAPSPRRVYASLGRVRYAEGNVSWLLIVKPTLLGSEPVDIGAYALSNPDFPQQSTGDQSFDDAQWEAYRKLGEHVGARLFGTQGQRSATRWCPRWLDDVAFELLERLYAPMGSVAAPRVPASVPAVSLPEASAGAPSAPTPPSARVSSATASGTRSKPSPEAEPIGGSAAGGDVAEASSPAWDAERPAKGARR